MAASLVFRLHARGPEVVREVLLERGWEEYDEEGRGKEDWNLYWRGSAFRISEHHKLLPWQRLNHHPKTHCIARKDCLARNLRRMKAVFGSSLYDFSPTVFILPSEYVGFLNEYHALSLTTGPPVYWICKPVDQSRGRGIFVFQDMKEFGYDCSVIVQRYVSKPLLISGYKFDLRIYVCVKSFHPLTIYIHQEGLVRFATERYDLTSLENLYSHLTNTSINKLGPFYKTDKESVGQGCKWTMSKFRRFLHSQEVNSLLLWQRINNIVTLTLLSIAPSVPLCQNCVELFGFDILIDFQFKPWLLEVNYSPALTLDCPADVTVKKELVSDLIDLMNYTSVDSLREKAYRKPNELPPSHIIQPLRVPVPSKVKEAKFQKKSSCTCSSQPQLLPPLKTPHQAEKTNQRQCAFASNQPRQLPPLDLHKMNARGRKTTITVTRTLNQVHGPHLKTDVTGVNRQSWLKENRSLHVSEVTNCDDTETEAVPELSETDVSSQIPDPRQSGPGFRRPAVSSTLPNIYRGSQGPLKTPVEGPTAQNGQLTPPPRVGDFIRTFPFNTATLKASQNRLDIKAVIQELHKLTARVSSTQSDRRQRRRGEEKLRDTQDQEVLDSLFWGPEDPPLLSQC